MANASNERFSDLNYARALSKRLRRGGTGNPAPHAPHYVRFEPKHGLAENRDSKDHWGRLLDKCCHESGASGAFLMDGSGLMIAMSGNATTERAQEIGARLQPGLDQVEQINGTNGAPCTLCVQAGPTWVDATRFTQNDLRLTLGLLTAAPIAREVREATLRLLQVALT